MRRFCSCLVVLFWGCNLSVASTGSVSYHADASPLSLPAAAHFEELLLATAPTTTEEDAALTQAIDTYAKPTSPTILARLKAMLGSIPDRAGTLP